MPTYVDPASRSRLADCQQRLTDLRKQRQRAIDHRDAAQQALTAMSNGGTSANDLIKTPEFKRTETALKDLNDIQLQIASVEQEHTYLLGRISGVDGGNTLNEGFLSDPAAMTEWRIIAESNEPFGDRIMGTWKSRDQLLAEFDQRRNLMASAGDVVLPSDAARTTFYGVVPQLRRQIRLLDLIPTAPMDSGSFDVLTETGSLDSGPAETDELTVKPSDNLAFTEQTVKARTIPVWTRISRQTLGDVPGLSNVIQTRLMYKVERRLENQIIGGDGTGVNLLGIVHTSGIGAPASVTGDSVNSDLVLNALGSVLTSEAEPNAACLNPADVIKMLKVKAAGSGQRLDSPGAFAAALADLTLWGLPVIASTGVATGHALVGDFTRGAILFIREGINIRVSDSDQADFINNAVKILAEGRWALLVQQPAAFAYVPLTFAN